MLLFVVPFCSIFILIGCGLMIFTGRRIVEGWQAARWPHTVGVVSSVESKDTSDSDSPSREILVRYSYTVDGVAYDGSRVHPTYGKSSFEEAHRGLEQVLEPGKKVRVYYRAGEPERSTLAVGFYSGSLAGFFGGALFAAAGLGFLLIFWFAFAGDWNYAAGVTVIE
jgi:hypothetical protein